MRNLILNAKAFGVSLVLLFAIAFVSGLVEFCSADTIIKSATHVTCTASDMRVKDGHAQATLDCPTDTSFHAVHYAANTSDPDVLVAYAKGDRTFRCEVFRSTRGDCTPIVAGKNP